MRTSKINLLAALGLALLSGPAAAASITCAVTPEYSALADGETLTLGAVCNGALISIDWRMDGVSVSGAIPLPGHAAGKPAYFITPVGAGGANNFAFTAVGVPASTADTFGGSNTARVAVKPSSAVVAKAAGVTAPMTPVAASCGSANSGTVTAMPSGVAACSSGKSALQIAGPSDFSWTCESLTGGADANCYAMRGTTTTTPTTTSPTPTTTTTTNVVGACGIAANQLTLVPPPSHRCAAGNTAGPIITSSMQYSWSCSGTGSGGTVSCSAPRGYTVTATAGTGGTITPASKVVTAYGTTTFTVTPAAGYTATVTGCNGTLSGSTYTTGQVYANCAVSATFKAATTTTTVPTTTTGGGDPGTGSWWPSATRLIADQTGTALSTISYVPGCLNGAFASSGSDVCAARTINEGFSFVAGNVLGIRYLSKTALTANRYFRISSGFGGSVGSGLKAWLSADPASTYESVPSGCRHIAGATLLLVTGGNYCQIQPATRYYLFLRDDAGTAQRYQVDETSADFN